MLYETFKLGYGLRLGIGLRTKDYGLKTTELRTMDYGLRIIKNAKTYKTPATDYGIGIKYKIWDEIRISY